MGQKTKNISLDDESIKKMESLVCKHKGNFSSAIRELIVRSDKNLPKGTFAIDEYLLDWMLDELDGRIIPDSLLDRLIDPLFINNINGLERFINDRFQDLEWDINLEIKCDNVKFPFQIMIEITGNHRKAKFAASMISQYLIKNSNEDSPLGIKAVSSNNNSFKVELSSYTDKKEAINSLNTFFGNAEEMAKAIKDRKSFWRCVINRHVLSNYNMVTIHKNYFEDILAGKIPMGEIMIETLAKRPIQDIPLREMLGLIKQVYEASRVVDKVDIRNEKIILFHNYRNSEAIERIKKQIVILLENNGHIYDVKSTTNMIILVHKPNIGIKINEIVNKLKESGSNLDNELIMYLSFLKGLKHITDMSMSITLLGRRIGRVLMQEYEKEKFVKSWNLEIFQKAFENIDAKIHRDSEWKLEGKNLLYRIRKCGITHEEDTFDAYICRTVREAFKGALDYAFGSRAELDIKKLITHGDNICEVSIKLKEVKN